MADTQITFTIPENKVQRVINAMKGLYPIPQINNGTEETPNWENEFTDGQWAKESVRRLVIREVKRYETKKAYEQVAVELDDEIIS